MTTPHELRSSISPSILDVLRCQQTLAPLVPHQRGLYSQAADLVYPVRDGLVFMGYPKQDKDFIELTMEEEQVWQTQNVERDLKFLEGSAPAVVMLIELLQKVLRPAPGSRALEVGSGSGWVSWLFAEAGFDTWITDFEANSLALGWNYEHPMLAPGKRIVSDATLLPFGDATFDLVICKELAHHIKDKRRLLSEMNRVLKPGGSLLFTEPVRGLWAVLHYWRDPDPHSGHVIVWTEQYTHAIRASGFRIVRKGLRYGKPDKGRFPLTPRIKRRANCRLWAASPGADPSTWLYSHIGGGSLVVFAKKHREAPRLPRPKIKVSDPDRLVVTDEDREEFRPLVDALQHAAEGLGDRRISPDRPLGAGREPACSSAIPS